MSPAARAEVVVVGGGVLGRSVAWQLGRRGVRGVVLLEARELGHTEGSSHGAGRVYRATYTDPLFLDLCVAGRPDWEALERACGAPLLAPSEVVLFGHRDGPWRAFTETVLASELDAEVLDLPRARAALPWLRLLPGDGVLVDRTGAVIQAARVLEALLDQAVAQGVRVEAGRPVRGLERQPSGTWRLDTPQGPLEAGRVVLAAGPWTARLRPELAPHLSVLEQTAVLMPEVPALPVWAWLGELGQPGVAGDFYYGLENGPERAHKVARHDLQGAGVDPDAPRPEPDPREVLEFWRWRMRPTPGTVRTERCRYTATASEDLVLTELPRGSGCFVGTGLSGHGFKFGPVLGRILGALVLDEPVDVAPFTTNRARFGVPGSGVP